MEHGQVKAPIHLWIIGFVTLLWNAMGAFDYTATKLRLEFYMSNFEPQQLDYFYGLPAWFTAFWALGVWCAVLGSIALLIRTRWAIGWFAVSLLGLIVTSIYAVFFSDGVEIMGTGGAVFSAVIFVVAVLLLVYSRKMTARGMLR